MAKKKTKKRDIAEPIEHVVSAIMKKGHPREEAYAIAIGRLQDLGYIKKGTTALTKKGRAVLSKHYKEPKKVRLAKVNMARKYKKKKL